MKLRPIIFWVHLAAGIIAGVVIAILSFTGAAISFEKQLIGWAERDAHRIARMPPSARLPLDDLIAKVQLSQPAQSLTSLTVDSAPDQAVLMHFGRTNAFYVNPYTGESRPATGSRMRRFMEFMKEWHRWLGRTDADRAAGKAITGASNMVFLTLLITGIYLWWPRVWSRRAWNAVLVLKLGASGRARDWNWHNVVGAWTAPVLLVLTLTALPISYRWAGTLVYRMTGTEPPGAGRDAGRGEASSRLATPADGAKPLSPAALVAAAEKAVPEWRLMTLRMAGGDPRRGPKAEPREAPGQRSKGKSARAISINIQERAQWPRFSSTQLSLDPYTGDVSKRESYADYNTGRKVRSWMRFLHTGEALGVAGQTIAAFACLGALVLVYTGFALAWRRFFYGKRTAVSPVPSTVMAKAE